MLRARAHGVRLGVAARIFICYAGHGVEEVVMADAQQRRVDWLALGQGGEYVSVERSGLIVFGPGELAEQIDWP